MTHHLHLMEPLVHRLLAANIIQTKRVYQAMLETDRNFYCPSFPYEDSPQYIGYDATISAPHMHAMCLEILAPQLEKENCKALDVGCGSGYFTSCLYRLSKEYNGSCFGIDYIDELVNLSRTNIAKDDESLLTNNKIILKNADGWKGWKEHAPFDCIHVGAAAASLPKDLVDQLKFGGVMVIPIGPKGGTQSLFKISKDMDGNISKEEICGVRYVPLVEQKE